MAKVRLKRAETKQRDALKNIWNVPDWRDGAAYPDNLTDHQWRWQFLRRRDDYRDDWHDISDGDQTRRFVLVANNQTLREKYGIAMMAHPGEPEIPPHYFLPDKIRRIELGWPSTADAVILVPFDLDRPLGLQLERARERLTESQDTRSLKTSREHRKKWPLYLRVLDAREAEATFDEIGRTLLAPDGHDDRAIEKQTQAAALAKQTWEAARNLIFKERS
jgi:hypothetical protein